MHVSPGKISFNVLLLPVFFSLTFILLSLQSPWLQLWTTTPLLAFSLT